MGKRTDNKRIVAGVLQKIAVDGTAFIATAAGFPPSLGLAASAALHGLIDLVKREISNKTDYKDLCRLLRADRAAMTVDTFREMLVVAAGLKPEFDEPIDALADAVEARKDGRDDERYQQACRQFFTVVLEKIPEISKKVDQLLDGQQTTHQKLDDIQAHVQEINGRLANIKPDLGIGISNSPMSDSKQKVLEVQLSECTLQLQQMTDQEGKKRWEEVNRALDVHDWQRVVSCGEDLEAWLNEKYETLSESVRVQVLLVLADVAVIRDSGLPFENRNETTQARDYLSRAQKIDISLVDDETAGYLLRVRAKLAFIDGQKDEADQLIDGMDAPGAVALKLRMAIDSGNHSDASDYAASQNSMDKKWVAAAIMAHIRAGQSDRADDVLDWAKNQDELTIKVCTLVYARERYMALVRSYPGQETHLVSANVVSEIKEIKRILLDRFPGLLAIKPEIGLEAEALEIALLIGHLTRDRSLCSEAAEQLVKHEPVMYELGRSVLRGDIDPIDGLADRYLNEHPDVFRMQMMGIALLNEVKREHQRALDLLLPMLEVEQDEHRREEIVTRILICVYGLEQANVSALFDTVSQTLGQEHRLTIMLKGIGQFKDGEIATARRTIEPLADTNDYEWLQLAANFAIEDQDWQEAAKLMHQVNKLVERAETLRQEGDLWYRAGDHEKCIAAYERLLKLQPDHMEVHVNLAGLYRQAGQYPQAIAEYKHVWKAGSSKAGLAHDYAIALRMNGDLDGATELLQSYITEHGESTEMEVILHCVQLMESQGKQPEAFDLLYSSWDRFESNYQYLQFVMKFGYASGHERQAHDATVKLIRMSEEGMLPEGTIRRTTIDDFIADRQKHEGYLKELRKIYLSGKVPWLTVSRFADPHFHSVLLWRLRTQKLIPFESVDHLAEYSIYSTNSFTPLVKDEQSELVRIKAPENMDAIVVDMSSLITLHRLGLLDRVLGSFETVYLPESYHELWREDQTKIGHHQPSQIESLQAVLQAVRDGLIRVVDKPQDTCPILNDIEQADTEDRPVIRICQVVRYLASQGQLTADKQAEAERMSSDLPCILSDEQANDALANGEIHADDRNLSMVATYGILDELRRGLSVIIDKVSHERLENDLAVHDRVVQSGRWYRDLVNEIKQLSNVKFHRVTVDEHVLQINETGSELAKSFRIGIEAGTLADQMSLPLLVDDRYCQQASYAVRQGQADVAFGTDAILNWLSDKELLTVSDQANHYLQLMAWRYKFLILPMDVLLEMAARFPNAMPGEQLRKVAVYVQDCMQDLGLFGGLEPVDPPTSMAIRLQNSWISAVAELIERLWQDKRFNRRQAIELTRWSLRHLLPGWPRNNLLPTWLQMADLRNQRILGELISRLIRWPDTKKANQVIRWVCRCLGVRHEALASAVCSVGLTIKDIESVDSRGKQALAFRLAQIGLGGKTYLDWRLMPVLAEVKNLASVVQSVPAEIRKVLCDRQYPDQAASKLGRFLCCQYQDQVHFYDMLDLMLSRDAEVRSAVVDILLNDAGCPMTEHSKRLLADSRDAITASDVDVWVPALDRIHGNLISDILLNLEAVRQSRVLEHHPAIEQCMEFLIRPKAGALLAIDGPGWDLLQKTDNSSTPMALPIGDTESFEDLLKSYDQQVGHLTLASPNDLGSCVAHFIENDGDRTDAWQLLHDWLVDPYRPWRRYHAAQALLMNPDLIPADKLDDFQQTVLGIIKLVLPDQQDADEAQVWYLESELAAHYLKIIEVQTAGVDPDRSVAVAWWLAGRMVELFITDVQPDKLADFVREFRGQFVQRNIAYMQEMWAWLCLKPFAPARHATILVALPRIHALLNAVGRFVQEQGVNGLSPDTRLTIRDCFHAAQSRGGIAFPKDRPTRWMWDDAIPSSAKQFYALLPEEERDVSQENWFEWLAGDTDAEQIELGLKTPGNVSTDMAAFNCIALDSYMYGHNDIDDRLWSFIADKKNRTACIENLNLAGCVSLVNAILKLVLRNREKAVRIPFLFLKMAEAAIGNDEKARLFATAMIVASAASHSTGAIKACRAGKHKNQLQPIIKAMSAQITNLANYDPAFRLRMQTVLTSMALH